MQTGAIEGSLLERASYVRKESSGFYSLLPLGQMVINKIVNIIENILDEEPQAYKITLPSLQSPQIWRQSGRFEKIKEEIFQTSNNEYLLAPTFEEQVSLTVKDMIRSHRQLPLRVYQTSTKWRNELRPRAGLCRLKEFLMNDTYTFDANSDKALETFNIIERKYIQVFSELKLPVVAVEASTGMMGGEKSVEFHYISPTLGEDTILVCDSCKYAANKEVIANSEECPKCHTRIPFKEYPGLELGHLFLLGTRYSGPFNLQYTNEEQKRELVHMGCYGLGVSRILEALAAHHSDSDGLLWPIALAPFHLNIIFKFGVYSDLVAKICKHFNFKDDAKLLIDDRDYLSVGKRLKDSFLLGIDKTVIVGNSWKEHGKIEVIDRWNSKCESVELL